MSREFSSGGESLLGVLPAKRRNSERNIIVGKTALMALIVGVAAALPAASRAEMVVEWWGQQDYCRQKGMTIELSKYGKEGLINAQAGKKPIEGIHALSFDLSPIKRGTKVYRASLRMQAPLKPIRTDKRAYMSIGQGHWYHDPLRLYAEIEPWKPIEIYVVEGLSEGGKPVYDKAKPLKLEPPQYKSFDLTEAVRAWVAGKQPNHGLLVRQLDLWDWAPSRTVLEVAYEGKLSDPPPQAGDLKVVHRKGQTFITWTEVDKPIDKEKVLWKEFEETFKKYGPRQGRFYRIYRSEKPITAGNIAQAELIDEIWPLSGYDFRLQEHMTRGEDWMGLNPECLVTRYVITDAPDGLLEPNGTYEKMPEWQGRQLPLHTGLYVHSPKQAGKSYYAVTSCINGVENTRNISAANSAAEAVAETVGPGEPILYRVLRQAGWRADEKVRETQFFLYWAAPPFANQPRRPVHIMVGLNGPAPSQELVINYSIGDMYGSDLIRGTHVHSWKGAARIVAIVDDASFGAKDYWSSWNTLLSREQAKSEPYADRIAQQFTPLFKALTKRAAMPEGP